MAEPRRVRDFPAAFGAHTVVFGRLAKAFECAATSVKAHRNAFAGADPIGSDATLAGSWLARLASANSSIHSGLRGECLVRIRASWRVRLDP